MLRDALRCFIQHDFDIFLDKTFVVLWENCALLLTLEFLKSESFIIFFT